MIREECWKEAVSPEAEKITHIQTSTGSQYLMNDRSLSTAHESRVGSLAATTFVRLTFRLHQP